MGDTTVYLPETMKEWAKANKVNLSRVLREALGQLRREEQEMESTLKGAKLVKLAIEDQGRTYIVRFTGVLLAENRAGAQVYLTDDERVVIYEPDHQRYHEVEDAEAELGDWLESDAYVDTMNSLGISPEVDLATR